MIEERKEGREEREGCGEDEGIKEMVRQVGKGVLGEYGMRHA